MKTLSKNDHVCIILEFYKAGYITILEKDKLIARIYNAIYYGVQLLDIQVSVEGRELRYSYWLENSSSTVTIKVEDDFTITYNVKKRIFIEGELR